MFINSASKTVSKMQKKLGEQNSYFYFSYLLLLLFINKKSDLQQL